MEGPKHIVIALFDKISLDGRHSEVNLVNSAAIHTRVHDSWMGKSCVDGSSRAWSQLKW